MTALFGRQRRTRRRRLLLVAAVLLVAGATGLAWCDFTVGAAGADRIHSSVADTPYHRVGLLLGTVRDLGGGRINLHYRHRLDAAVELFRAGKVSYLLVSGDNSRADYDEPTAMMNDLVARGVPANRIVRDYAGFRTLDSVVRAREVFGVAEALVISQRFHVARAIYLGDHRGLNLEGYAAADVPAAQAIKVRIREVAARALAVLDVVLARRPKFLGPRIAIDANGDGSA